MVRRRRVFLQAPRGVEAIREIDAERQPTYRHSPSAPERLLFRINEQPEEPGEHRPIPFAVLTAVPFAFVGFVMGSAWLVIGATILFWAAALFEERHKLGARARRPRFGYRGTFRLEDHWLYSPSPEDRLDVATDLARLENVHLVGTDCGTNLVAEMRDGEVLDLALAIADVEIARYLARWITEASNVAKGEP